VKFHGKNNFNGNRRYRRDWIFNANAIISNFLKKTAFIQADQTAGKLIGKWDCLQFFFIPTN
jgi:hypothetical protein